MAAYDAECLAAGETKDQIRLRCKTEDFTGQACTNARCRATRHPVSKTDAPPTRFEKIKAAMQTHGVRESTREERQARGRSG